MRKRNIADKRNFDTLIFKAETFLKRGFISLSEYREIEAAVIPLWTGEEVETIRESVKNYLELYGVHADAAGIGWKLKYY